MKTKWKNAGRSCQCEKLRNTFIIKIKINIRKSYTYRRAYRTTICRDIKMNRHAYTTDKISIKAYANFRYLYAIN